MKFSIAPVLFFASTVALVTACSSTPKQQAFNENAPIEEQTATFIKDKNGDDFKSVKKVIIPYFQVEYVVKSSASATAFGDGGGSATAAQLYELKGISDEKMQNMTNRYYENFVADLKAQGHEVISHEELLKFKSYQAFKNFHKATPHVEERANSTSKFFSYKAMPTYFIDGDQRLSVKNALGSAFSFGKRPAALEEALEDESGAKVVRARFVVDFVSQQGTKNGNMAAVNSSYQVGLAPQFTSITVPTESILVHLKEPLFTDSTEWVKSVNELNGASNRTIGAVSSLLGNSRSTREYEIQTEGTAWDASVTKVIGSAQKLFFSKMK